MSSAPRKRSKRSTASRTCWMSEGKSSVRYDFRVTGSLLRKSYLTLLLLAGCALRPPSPEAFAFGVMGDAPYNDREEAPFVAMIARMNAEPLEFVVHVGDFKADGGSPCRDALFARRRAQFDSSAHPLIYTPG